MAVRSYTPGKREEECHRPRKSIDRSNKKTAPENTNSKTQRRKRNLDAHKAGQFRR